MRLIVLFILLSLGADAQIIRANPFYRPSAAAASTFLLDDYPNAAAAYSLRKLKSSYSGSAIRIRRDSTGNAETDIGFTANGDLDTAAIKTHCRNNSCFVTTWYDQSGNARNATQATAASQPRIVNSGTIDRFNTKPVVRTIANGSARRLNTTFSTLQSLPVTLINVFNVYSFPTINRGYINIIAGTGTVEGSRYSTYIDSVGLGSVRKNTSGAIYNTIKSITANTQQTLSMAFFGTGNITGYYNGNDGENNTNYSGSQFNTASNFSLFGSGSTSLSGNLGIQEAVIYLSDESSNKTGIGTNINNYYGLW